MSSTVVSRLMPRLRVPTRPVSRTGAASAALAVAALACYAAALATRAFAFSSATFLLADASAPAYLSPEAGASLAMHTELLPTLLEGRLVGLPAGHLAIQLLGPLLGLLTVGLMCWTVSRLRGPWLATAAAGFAAGPVLLWAVLFPSAHVFTFLSAALLAYALFAVAQSHAPAGLLAFCGVVAGLAVIGDQGFLATGIVPLAIAGGGLWTVRRNRRDVTAVATILAIAATVVVTGELALHLIGVRLVGDAFFGSTGVGRVSVGTGVLGAAHALGDIVSGQWSGLGSSPLSQPWSALALMAGFVVPLVAPMALFTQLRGRRQPVDAGRVAYLFFWSAADLLVLAVYVLFGYSENGYSAHYILPCFLSAVATLPFVAPPALRSLPRLVAAGLAAVQAVGVLSLPASDFSGLHAPADGPRVVAALEAAGLTKGYADYWESHPLTWISGEAVHVYPTDVLACTANTRAPNICPYMYADASWYVPVPGATFLITRRTIWPCVSSAPGRVLGPPARSVIVDAETTILVYSYDIASRFASFVATGCAS